ncbi:hypothetical protein RI367_000176 [Sorochytrium milnesiophthora]
MELAYTTLLLIAAMLWSTQGGLIKRGTTTTTDQRTVRSNFYVVEFERPPPAQRRSGKDGGDHAAFVSAARSAGVNMTVQFEYLAVMHGVSVRLNNDHDVDRLAALPNVKSVYPVYTYRRPPDAAVTKHQATAKLLPGVDANTKPFLASAHNLTGVVQVAESLNVTGAGVKVGVIDSGIDFLHPAFATDGRAGTCTKFKGKGCRVQYGFDLAGTADDWRMDAPFAEPRVEGPMDCEGHGTHVAGIIGGLDDRIRGVAPGVTFGAYRVFGCKGTTSSDRIIKAMELAYLDGMSVVNLSLGGLSTYDDDPTATVATRLAELGMIVVGAMGNDGPKGLWQTASPASARKAFGVCSFDNVVPADGYLTVGMAQTSTYRAQYRLVNNSAMFPVDRPLDVAALGPSDGCSVVNKTSTYAHRVVAMKYDEDCSTATKARNLAAAGAVGAVIFSVGSTTPLTVDVNLEPLPIPVAYLSKGASYVIMLGLNDDGIGKASLTFDNKTVGVPSRDDAQPSAFSSWGPGAELEIKPDVCGVGGDIGSTFPTALGNYTTMSGTSMAAPYVAGVLALYLEAVPQRNNTPTRFAQAHMRMQNTARPAAMPGRKALMWPVARQGAGLVDALAMLQSRVEVSPSKLELGDIPASGPQQKQSVLTVKNTSPTAKVTYTVAHAPAASVAKSGQQVQYSNSSASTVILPSTLTLDAGESHTVAVTIAPPMELPAKDHWIVSGYIVLTPTTATAEHGQLHVPYTLLKGDYNALQTVDQQQSPPYLTDLDMGFQERRSNETVEYTMHNTSFPLIAVTATHPIRLLSITVHDHASQRSLGYMQRVEFVPQGKHYLPVYVRNGETGDADPDTISADELRYGWDGSVVVDPVRKPLDRTVLGDGAYYAQIAITQPKFDNDALEEENVQVFRTPKIVVKRLVVGQ